MRSALSTVTIALVMVLAAACAREAVEDVSVRDVLTDPSRYYGMLVQLRGEVRSNTVIEPGRGFYDLMDESDKIVKIQTRNLPAPGRTVVVKGKVMMAPGAKIPHVWEAEHCVVGEQWFCGTGEWEAAVVVASAVVAGLLIALVIVLIRPVRAPVSVATPTPLAATRTQVFVPEPRPTERLPFPAAFVYVLNNGAGGTTPPIRLKERMHFGREVGDVTLADDTVSREHAYIMFDGGVYRLFNQSQVNPTRVNGELLNGSRGLVNGDLLTMGAVKMKFSLES